MIIEFNLYKDSFRLAWAFIISLIGGIGMVLALLCRLNQLFLPCFLPMVFGFWSVCFHTAKARYILRNHEDMMVHPDRHASHIIGLAKTAEWTFNASIAGLIVMIGCWIYISL